MARTGTGCTLAFSSGSTYTGEVQSFTLDGEEVPVIDITNMSTTGWRIKIPGSLKEPPVVTVNYYYNAGTRPPLGTRATLTITWPDPDGAGSETSETLAGTGFVTSLSCENGIDEAAMGTYTFQFDGGANSGTAPTFS